MYRHCTDKTYETTAIKTLRLPSCNEPATAYVQKVLLSHCVAGAGREASNSSHDELVNIIIVTCDDFIFSRHSEIFATIANCT